MKSLIIALDLPTAEDALDLVDRLGDAADYYKVGAHLFTRTGPPLVQALKDRGKRVFLDLKYHDIPYTVAGAVESAAALGVDMLTLHASGGVAMMQAAREAVGDEGPTLVGVTLLTSFTAADVEQVWAKEIRSLRDEVARLSGLAAEAGLDGVVSSALEVEALKRKHGSEFVVVTPGIRPAGEVPGDQVRTATPAEAVRAGADYLVIGRPVHGAADPGAVVGSILDEISAAAEGSV
ncbi:MAG TPA: orotidine-5'-phosphate decarboxylase [Longimicrobiales bacterium]|nr:orotidine-5'-phosphate decarboxylase [Longimicrobiales bacterium]